MGLEILRVFSDDCDNFVMGLFQISSDSQCGSVFTPRPYAFGPQGACVFKQWKRLFRTVGSTHQRAKFDYRFVYFWINFKSASE